jgi:hypothetical protein
MKKLCGFLVLIAALVLSGKAMTEQLRVGEDLRHERVILPPTIPDRNLMTVVDYTMFIDEAGAAGILIFYNDVRTKWDVDSIETYDVEGNLLLIAWIDRFGISQVAMDRGLLDSAHPVLDGTFVIVGVGMAL